MTTYVILGHGGFNPDSGSYLKEILVPQDTKLKFFSEAGSALTLPAVSRGGELDSDYAHVAPAWQQLKEAQPELGATKVTYNFTLYPDDNEEERTAAKAADWNGAELIMIESGTTYLCTGTAETCPTPALLTSTDEEVLKPERWLHKCDGILGKFGGNNNEIHWVACTSFEVPTPQLPTEMTKDTDGPGWGTNWVPDEEAIRKTVELNKVTVKDSDNKDQIAVSAGGLLVLIGDDHPTEYEEYVKRQDNFEQGVIKVTKGGVFSKGTLDVKGISANKAKVEEAIGEFSEKKVTFS
jgi:hypothetical protein